jgi:hypothetical protein
MDVSILTCKARNSSPYRGRTCCSDRIVIDRLARSPQILEAGASGVRQGVKRDMHKGLRQPFQRYVLLVGVVCLALLAVGALGVLVLWSVPSLLARHPSQGMSAVQRLTAVNAIRTATVTFVVAVGAAVTVWFTARSYAVSREGQGYRSLYQRDKPAWQSRHLHARRRYLRPGEDRS